MYLKLAFPGRSIAPDADHFIEAIESELRQRAGIRKIVFDLSKADPINNTAGRVWDFAQGYCKRGRFKIEFHIPRNVYADLRLLDSSPTRTQKGKPSRGAIDLVITRPVKQSEFFKRLAALSRMAVIETNIVPETKPQGPPAGGATAPERTVFDCDGRIRAVRGECVRVSLFTKNGEVVGDLVKSQFPSGSPRVGGVFRYRAIVSSPGTTEINIAEIPERLVTADEILDFWQEAKVMVPSEEF